MSAQRARLVRRHPVYSDASVPEYDDGLLARPAGFRRVLGGPGTGKTTLLARTVARRVGEAGVDPERILVLTSSRSAAEWLRGEITRRLTAESDAATGRTIREPLVRTVHSYAYAVLRVQASARGAPPPRLLAGPEQDVLIRELLAGDRDAGAAEWPARLRPALSVPGFAEELRDLVLRAAERGLGPDDLIKLGRTRGHEEWVAAGIFWQQYEQVTLLASAGGHALGNASAPALDAAELVSAALGALTEDADLLVRERGRVRHLFVDDAQHLDPLQFRLARTLGSAAEDFVLAGDPDQAVFSFRGADPELLTGADPGGERTVTLRTSHRMNPGVQAAVSTVAGALTGSPTHRLHAPGAAPGDGGMRLRVLPTHAAQASWIADQLRRAHLVDGVPWSEMAVLVRSPARAFPVLQRALRAAGVPIAVSSEQVPLAKQPVVRPLLRMLTLAAAPSTLDSEAAELLLTSAVGGADPMALRRLRRGLRRLETAAGGERSSDELLVQALSDNDVLTGLADAEAAPVRRIASLLDTAREAIDNGSGPEQVLWRLWQDSGLERALLRRSAGSGSLAAQADRDLDSVVALFDAAGRYVDRLPRASVVGFAEYLSAQNIAGDSLAPSAQRGEGVELLSAHAAAGREWALVTVAGVQEGNWPDLRLRGSLLGVERLVDLLSGVDSAAISATAPVLAEERRLFYLAVSRARHTLLVTAVSGEDEQPSRFLYEQGFEESGVEGFVSSAVTPTAGGRPLVLAELVGELRSVACDAEAPYDKRRLAARQLAKLASAGVTAANPENWYGVPEVSSDEPVHPAGQPIRVSPSTVDVLARCPLRWMVERHGGNEPAQLAAVTGTLVHALVQQAANGIDEQNLRSALDEAWSHVDAGAPWFSRRERRRVEQMVRNFLAWLRASRSQFTAVGVETDMEVDLPPAHEEAPIRLRGRVDRLERDEHGRPVIVDIKTGKTPVTAADAEEHPQLATYQLAALLGAFGQSDAQPGGAELVYVAKSHGKTGATRRQQPPIDEHTGVAWLELVRAAAASTRGPEYQANENPDCDRCPVRTACPLRPEGRQVTGP